MLQTIRDHTHGWIAGTIISLIILSFALWGIHSYIAGGTADLPVASVNGTDITRDQLRQAYDRLLRQAQAQSDTPLSQSDEIAIQNKALQALIEIAALTQAAAAEGFQISNQQIDNYLQSMPQFQVNGQFSIQRFQEILSATMMSPPDFLELMRNSLLVDQPAAGIRFSAFALPDEVDGAVALINQERDVSYISVPLSKFLAKGIVVPADKITAYYNEHKDDFKTPEQVSVEYLALSPRDLKASIQTDDATLKNFYNENINNYTQPSTWKLGDVLIALPADASSEQTQEAFETANAVARALRSGGDITKVGAGSATLGLSKKGAMTLQQLPAELQKVVPDLSSDQPVSDPVQVAEGIVVVKLLAQGKAVVQPFDAVKDKVKDRYIEQHADEKFTEVRDNLADVSYEHPESLQSAASALNLPIQTSDLFTRDAGTGIAANDKVRQVAFSNDVLNLRNNSDVIQLSPDSVVVIRVKSHVESTVKPLSDVNAQIVSQLQKAAAQQQATDLVNNLYTQLSKGADVTKILADNQLTWQQAGSLGRYSTKVDSAILDTAFRLPHPDAQHKQTYGIAKLPSGVAVVALKAIKDGKAADAKQQSVFAEQEQNNFATLEYALYRQSQLANSKIDIIKQ